jgi:LPPG:FO 2-phospho-L-lactate transferase
MRMTALAGGVGAAKFLGGLVRAMDPGDITIIGNTGDDAEFYGLHVSPDLDIVIYTLAGIVDELTGWGIARDTNRALEQTQRLGAEGWFRLGDADIGTHLLRTEWLRDGVLLSEVTDRIRRRLGVRATVIPMSDEQVRTKLVNTNGEILDFQEYFVHRQHADEIEAVVFAGAAFSTPAPGVLEAIREADRIIICPSNPVISIGPILAVPGIREALSTRREVVFGISPIVQGAALKGPADKLLPVIEVEVSAYGVANHYLDVCANFVLDYRDAPDAKKIEELGVQAIQLDTVMETPEVAERLAKEILSA